MRGVPFKSNLESQCRAATTPPNATFLGFFESSRLMSESKSGRCPDRSMNRIEWRFPDVSAMMSVQTLAGKCVASPCLKPDSNDEIESRDLRTVGYEQPTCSPSSPIPIGPLERSHRPSRTLYISAFLLVLSSFLNPLDCVNPSSLFAKTPAAKWFSDGLSGCDQCSPSRIQMIASRLAIFRVNNVRSCSHSLVNRSLDIREPSITRTPR